MSYSFAEFNIFFIHYAVHLCAILSPYVGRGCAFSPGAAHSMYYFNMVSGQVNTVTHEHRNTEGQSPCVPQADAGTQRDSPRVFLAVFSVAGIIFALPAALLLAWLGPKVSWLI